MLALMATLINYPDVQGKLSKHIHDAIGKRRPCLADRPNLPYVEATILELLRYHTLVPLGVLHAVTKDICVSGYNIAKGTGVGLIYSIRI